MNEKFLYEPVNPYFYVRDNRSAIAKSVHVYDYLERLWHEIRELEFEADREKFLHSKTIRKVKIDDLKKFANFYEERYLILSQQDKDDNRFMDQTDHGSN